MNAGSVAHILRRTREVGVAGVARRLLHPAHEALRATRRRRWAETWGAGAPTQPFETLSGGRSVGDLRAALAGGVFFFDPAAEGLAARFLRDQPVAARAILQQAEATLAGDLAWVVPGGEADWHAALPNGGRWPLCDPERTGISDREPPGDVRLTWEVGRCPHLVRLAQAAWITGDDRFAHAAVAGIRSWLDENPPGVGIGWAHAQEVALRAVAWLWVFQLLRGSDAFDDETFSRWARAQVVQAEFVLAHLSDHVLTHNHLVSELGGLAVLGISLDALPAARAWRERGLALLSREILKQVDEEGVQSELSTHYHAFVLDSCIATLLLADRAGQPLPRAVRERVAGMAEFLSLLLRADGTLPAIGDTDAGRAFRLGTEPLDRRDCLAAAAVAFDRADWGAIAGAAPGAFWLAGARPVPGAADPPPPGRARCYRAAGIAVARTGFDEAAETIVFRAGATQFRRDVHTSHAHADALSLVWRLGPCDVLVDPGMYLYSEGQGWRQALRRTAAHACVVVDERDQADVTSLRFGVLGLEASRWLACQGSASSLAAVAEHPARGALRVRREVAWRCGGLLVLRDQVIGQGEHEISLWLPLPAGEAEIRGSEAIFSLAGDLRLRVQSFDDASLVLHRPGTDGPPGPGWLAPRYGVRMPGLALEIRLARGALPRRTLTLLQAARGQLPPAGRLESPPAGGARIVCASQSIELADAPGGRSAG